MVKITFNSLKFSRTKTGKLRKTKTGKNIFVWQQPKGKKVRPTISQIKQFRELRSKSAFKREKARKTFKKQFKFHEFSRKNITYNTYCANFSNRRGISKLDKLFRTLGLQKKGDRIRFFVGSFKASCMDKTKKCPDKTFLVVLKKGGEKYVWKGRERIAGDKYNMPREQFDITNDNFEDKYTNYLDNAEFTAQGIYVSTVCPRCGYDVLIDWISVCFQIVKVKGNDDDI